jgi:hypothetical protein
MQNPSKTQFSNTPREIPSRAKLSILFFNPSFLLGLVFIIIGSGTFYVVTKSLNFSSYFASENNLVSAEGIVTNVIAPSKGGKSNRKSWEVEFKYSDKTEAEIQGTCYSYEDKFKTGDEVKVLYNESSPSLAKIEGTEFNKFGLWLIGVLLLFPLGGIIVLIKHFKDCKKNLNILANGVLTKGKVITKSPTGTKINKKPVYKITFEFADAKKEYHSLLLRNTQTRTLARRS